MSDAESPNPDDNPAVDDTADLMIDTVYASSLSNGETSTTDAPEQKNQDDSDSHLRELIADAVNDSVEKAFKEYGRKAGRGGSRAQTIVAWGRIIKSVIIIVVIVALIVTGIHWWNSRRTDNVDAVDDHDLTLENKGIFGYKVTDFSRVILGRAKQETELIVEERDVQISTTTEDTGFAGLGIFAKSQMMIFHGTGEYTVDLSQITDDDISLDEDTHVITVKIPHAKLRYPPTIDSDKTEVGDTDHGWLAFGDMHYSGDDQKKINTQAQQRMYIELGKPENMTTADRFAKLSVTELFQPLVDTVSPAYKLVVVFDDGVDPTTEDSTSSSQSVSSSVGD